MRIVSLTCQATLFLAACAPDRARIATLEARVDSLARSLDTLAVSLGQSASAPITKRVTVSARGAVTLGSPSATVAIVEFTDYQCPFCRQHALQTLPKLIEEFVANGLVRYTVRDLPLPIHPIAELSAKATRCAEKQKDGAYWRFHEALFDAARITDTTVWRIAAGLGLDRARLDNCMSSPETTREVLADAAEASSHGLSATPTFVIGRSSGDSVTGEVIQGAYPIERFRSAIARAVQVDTAASAH